MTPFGRLSRAISTGSGFESTRVLGKWLVLSTAIGLVAGVGAIVFHLSIELATDLWLGGLVGWHPPAAAGEGSTIVLPMRHPGWLPLVTAVGGLLSGVIVFALAPEAEGHGTDAAIAAIHHGGARIRARIPPIKLVASAITIGAGGSGGREGPAAQISAAFGSLMGDWLGLDLHDRRLAVAAGMGAGIGAIFRAPLGGALLAAEILYVHDLEVEAIIPALIASIVGYTLFGAWFGFTPIFGDHPGLALGGAAELPYYALLGVLSGLGGLLYAHTFYRTAAGFHRLPLPFWLKPALGGLLVGGLGIWLPQVLHMGYGWVQLAMTEDGLAQLPLWVVVTLPFAKIAATSLSIGSGGSGGIFGPGMVIGGMLGASLWRLGHGVLPGMPAHPAAFVIIGMMALFGGIAHAPLAVMLMVAEMTGNLSLLAPAMIAVAVSTALVGDRTIYRSQLRDRASSPFHRVRLSFPMMSALLVRDAMTAPEADAAPTPAVTLGPDDTLDVALGRLADTGATWAAVVRDGTPIGRLTVRDVVATYKATLQRSVRRASTLPGDTSLFEARLADSSPLVGQTLREAELPRDALVVSITRAGGQIFPRAGTRFEAGDRIMIVTSRESERALRGFLETEPAS